MHHQTVEDHKFKRSDPRRIDFTKQHDSQQWPCHSKDLGLPAAVKERDLSHISSKMEQYKGGSHLTLLLPHTQPKIKPDHHVSTTGHSTTPGLDLFSFQ